VRLPAATSLAVGGTSNYGPLRTVFIRRHGRPVRSNSTPGNTRSLSPTRPVIPRPSIVNSSSAILVESTAVVRNSQSRTQIYSFPQSLLASSAPGLPIGSPPLPQLESALNAELQIPSSAANHWWVINGIALPATNSILNGTSNGIADHVSNGISNINPNVDPNDVPHSDNGPIDNPNIVPNDSSSLQYHGTSNSRMEAFRILYADTTRFYGDASYPAFQNFYPQYGYGVYTYSCGHAVERYTVEIIEGAPRGRLSDELGMSTLRRACDYPWMRCPKCVAEMIFREYTDYSRGYGYYLYDTIYHTHWIHWWRSTPWFESQISPDMTGVQYLAFDWMSRLSERDQSTDYSEVFDQCAEVSTGTPLLMCRSCAYIIPHPAINLERSKDILNFHIKKDCPYRQGDREKPSEDSSEESFEQFVEVPPPDLSREPTDEWCENEGNGSYEVDADLQNLESNLYDWVIDH
jgi:hypothetical protein